MTQEGIPITLGAVTTHLRRVAGARAAERKGIYDEPSAWEQWSTLERGDAVEIFRLRTGHTLLRSHMARVNWTDEASCRLCGAPEESLGHILSECPRLNEFAGAGAGDPVVHYAVPQLVTLHYSLTQVASPFSGQFQSPVE